MVLKEQEMAFPPRLPRLSPAERDDGGQVLPVSTPPLHVGRTDYLL